MPHHSAEERYEKRGSQLSRFPLLVLPFNNSLDWEKDFGLEVCSRTPPYFLSFEKWLARRSAAAFHTRRLTQLRGLTPGIRAHLLSYD
jgi:hypothetical protein